MTGVDGVQPFIHFGLTVGRIPALHCFRFAQLFRKAHAELDSFHLRGPLKGFGLNLGCFNSDCTIQAGPVGRMLPRRVTGRQKMRDIKTHCLFSEHL